jgi:hypothetical protein
VHTRTPDRAIPIVTPREGHVESLSMTLNDQMNMTFDSINEEHKNEMYFEDAGVDGTQTS